MTHGIFYVLINRLCLTLAILPLFLNHNLWAEENQNNSSEKELNTSIVHSAQEKSQNLFLGQESQDWENRALDLREVMQSIPQIYVRSMGGKGSGFSYRILGRPGSRSEVYIDEIPIFSGLSIGNHLNQFQLSELSRVEVKALSEDGSGTGALFYLKSHKTAPKSPQKLQIQTGSFGYNQLSSQLYTLGPQSEIDWALNLETVKNDYLIQNRESALEPLQNAQNQNIFAQQKWLYCSQNWSYENKIWVKDFRQGWPGSLQQPQPTLRENTQSLGMSHSFFLNHFTFWTQAEKSSKEYTWGPLDQFLWPALNQDKSEQFEQDLWDISAGSQAVFDHLEGYLGQKWTIKVWSHFQNLTPEAKPMTSPSLAWVVQRAYQRASMAWEQKLPWRLRLISGAGLDWVVDHSQNQFNPKIQAQGKRHSLFYQNSLLQKFSHFDWSISRQIGAWIPDLAYLYGASAGVVGNENLKNESNQLWQAQIQSHWDYFEFGLRLWHNQISNAIVLDNRPTGAKPLNTLGATLQGMDLHSRFEFAFFEWNQSINLMKSKNLSELKYYHHKELPETPQLNYLERVQFQFQKYALGYQVRFTQAFWRDQANKTRIGNAWIHSADATWKFNPSASLSLNLENLLSSQEEDPYNTYPQSPLSVYAQLKLFF